MVSLGDNPVQPTHAGFPRLSGLHRGIAARRENPSPGYRVARGNLGRDPCSAEHSRVPGPADPAGASGAHPRSRPANALVDERAAVGLRRLHRPRHAGPVGRDMAIRPPCRRVGGDCRAGRPGRRGPGHEGLDLLRHGPGHDEHDAGRSRPRYRELARCPGRPGARTPDPLLAAGPLLRGARRVRLPSRPPAAADRAPGPASHGRGRAPRKW